jgi:glutathione S-transferase
MIEFHAETGPDTQAIGIALEEMFLDYRIMPGKAPLPVIAMGGARVVGTANILPALARKTGRFLPAGDFARWFAQSIDMAALTAAVEASEFICGAFSIADMSVYPRLTALQGAADAEPAVARWARRVWIRPATGRGMGVIAG